jgi:hypothetical protein
MQFGSGVSSASSPSGKPALLLLTSTAGAGSGSGSGNSNAPPLSPNDVEATLLSAPGRPRARVSGTFPHGSSGAYVVALDLPSNYTGEVSVAVAGSGGSGGGGGGGGDGKERKAAPLMTFAVVRSPNILVTASLPVE